MSKQPGAKAIVAYQGKMLLILRDDKPTIPFPNTWSAPGGGIEEGETSEQAMRRECWEEISLIPQSLEACEVVVYEDGSVVHRFFAILSEEEYGKVKLGDEGQCLDWFTYEEALGATLSPRLRKYLEQKEENVKKLLERSWS